MSKITEKIKEKMKQVLTSEIFDFNNYNTRNRVILNMTPFLLELKEKGKIFDFVTQCDSFNNPLDVIDNNQLMAAVYIKEDDSVKWYCINCLVEATGVDFTEIEAVK